MHFDLYKIKETDREINNLRRRKTIVFYLKNNSYFVKKTKET